MTTHPQSLASSGVRLSQSYVTPKCSPSRAALMTGLYPWRLGMQRGAIMRFQPDGLNSSLTLLPQHLQQAGYQTHLVRTSQSLFALSFKIFLNPLLRIRIGQVSNIYQT